MLIGRLFGLSRKHGKDPQESILVARQFYFSGSGGAGNPAGPERRRRKAPLRLVDREPLFYADAPLVKFYNRKIIPYIGINTGFTDGVHNVSDASTYPNDWIVCFKEQVYNVREEKCAQRIYKDLQKCGISLDVAQQAIKNLVSFVPECFPRKTGVYGERARDLNGSRFFTETYLYALIGKEDARTILSLLSAVERAAHQQD